MANPGYTTGGDMQSPMDASSMYMRRPLLPAIRWSAILAGVAVGISIQMALTLLGIATGLSTTDISQGESVGTGPLLWAGFSMLVAAFIGGYVAARMSGLKRKSDGVLHGAVSWAVTTILFAVLATSVGGSLMSGVFTNMSQVARTAAGSNGQSPALGTMMQNQLGQMDAQSMQRFQQSIQAGQRDQAIQELTTTMNIEPGRAASIVDQALILSGSPSSASPQARQQANTAVQSAGMAAWLVFAAVALALALGIGGGVLGASGSRRVSWSTPPNMP